MLAMAAVGLVLSLETLPSRQARNPRELLGYLPPSTTAVLAVHVARSVKEVAGRRVLTQFQVGTAELDLSRLQRWTHIPLKDFETVVVGKWASGGAWDHFVIVLQTNTPRTGEDLMRLLPGARRVERERPDVIGFGEGPEAGVAWRVAEQIVAFAPAADGLGVVPAVPAQELGHFSAPLQDFIRHRIGPEADVWLAATPMACAGTAYERVLRDVVASETLGDVDVLGAWARFADDVDGELALRGRDEAAARRLAAALRRRPTFGESRVREEGAWVTAHARLSADAVLGAFRNVGSR